MADEPAYKGKIGRLPVVIRNEVNRRLLDNEIGTTILEWLNSDPRVLAVLDKHFHEQPISPQNLTEWRQGGYQHWLARQEEVDRLKDLSSHALELGKAAGGNISDGSAAIAGGRILTLLEGAADEDLEKLVKSITLLRLSDQEKEKIQIRRDVVRQRDEVIDLKKKEFQRKTCELFLKWYDDKRAKDVVESRASNAEKLEQLGQTMFGRDW